MYADLCEKHNAVYKYEKADFNFSKMCNDGAKAAKGEYLLFLNDDTEVMSGGWLRAMLGQAALEYAGAVGAKLLYPNSSEIQHCGIINIGAGPCHAFIRSDDRVPQYFCRNKLDYNWIAVTAACLCINRKKFESVGGFDESFPIAYNDVELCFKLYEAGFYNVRTDAVLYHYESVSRGADAKDKEKLKRLDAELERLYKKHPSLNRRDPFYNPAFSKTRVDFTLDPGLYALSNEIVGADMDISRYLSDRVRAELDTADAEDMLEIRGWAYIEGAALNNLNTCRLLLVNEENRALAIKTEKVLRFDISAMYGKKGSLNLAGFECAAKTSDIAGGTYKLGVMLINMGKKYVRLFDKTIEIK